MSIKSQVADGVLGTRAPKHVDELMARLLPATLREVASRVDKGDLAFLPSQVKFENGRINFGEGIGWLSAPGFDPATISLDQIEVLYVTAKDGRMGIEFKLFEDQPAALNTGEQSSLDFTKLILQAIIGASHQSDRKGIMDPDAAIDATVKALAILFEQSPEAATPRDMRKLSESFSKRFHTHLKDLRASFERTGVHPIDEMLDRFPTPGGTAH